MIDTRKLIKEFISRSTHRGNSLEGTPLEVNISEGNTIEESVFTKGYIPSLSSLGENIVYLPGCIKDCDEAYFKNSVKSGIWDKVTNPFTIESLLKFLSTNSCYSENCFDLSCIKDRYAINYERKCKVEFKDLVPCNSGTESYLSFENKIVEVSELEYNEKLSSYLELKSKYKGERIIFNNMSAIKYIIPAGERFTFFDEDDCIQTENITLDKDYEFIILEKDNSCQKFNLDNSEPEISPNLFIYFKAANYESAYDECTYNLYQPLYLGRWNVCSSDINQQTFNPEIDFVDNYEKVILGKKYKSLSNYEIISPCVSNDIDSSFIDEDLYATNDFFFNKRNLTNTENDNCYEIKKYTYQYPNSFSYKKSAYEKGVFDCRKLLKVEPYIKPNLNYCYFETENLKFIKLISLRILKEDWKDRYRKITVDIEDRWDYQYYKPRLISCENPLSLFTFNNNYYKFDKGFFYIWIPGLKTSEGIYTLSFSYIRNNKEIDLYSDISIRHGGNFSLDKYLPKGIKVISLIYSTESHKSIIGKYYYGIDKDITLLDLYSRNVSNIKLFKYDLKNISISLIKILIGQPKSIEECEIDTFFMDSELFEIVKYNFDNITNYLINLPLKNISEKECFDRGVFSRTSIFFNQYYFFSSDFLLSSPCYGEEDTKELSNWLPIDFLSLLWYCLSILIYEEVTQDNSYSYFVKLVLDDVLELNRNEILNNVLKDLNLKVMYNFRSNLISENEIYNNSSNALFTFILLKYIDLTSELKYLYYASEMSFSIEKFLFYKNLPIHNSTDIRISISSFSYSLLLYRNLERADIVERILEFIKGKHLPIFNKNSLIKTKSGNVLLNKQFNNLYTKNTDINIVYENYLDLVNADIYDRDLLNWLLADLDKRLDKQIGYLNARYTGWSNIIRDSTYKKSIKEIPSAILANGFINSYSVDSFFYFKSRSLLNLYNFDKPRSLNRMLGSIPENYKWFSKESKNPDGNLYSILHSVSVSFSLLVSYINIFKTSISLKLSQSKTLEKLAISYDIPVFIGERDEEYRQRFINYVRRPSINEVSIYKLLELYNLKGNLTSYSFSNLDHDKNDLNLFSTKTSTRVEAKVNSPNSFSSNSDITEGSSISFINEGSNFILPEHYNHRILCLYSGLTENLFEEFKSILPLGCYFPIIEIQEFCLDISVKNTREFIEIFQEEDNFYEDTLIRFSISPYCCNEEGLVKFYKIKLTKPYNSVLFLYRYKDKNKKDWKNQNILDSSNGQNKLSLTQSIQVSRVDQVLMENLEISEEQFIILPELIEDSKYTYVDKICPLKVEKIISIEI